MKWNKLTIETTTAAEDMLSYELSEMGMEGVEIEDHVPLSEEDRKIMYVDLLPDEIAPDDGKARISCYVDEKEDLQAVIAKIKAKIEELSAFLPMGSGEITLGVTEEEDWINNWKVFFKPFRLDDNIVIKPTWETLSDKKDDDIVIEIDPGTAFGSGSHETTKLCISQLKKYIKKDTELLDVGTGSGILSIIGLKLGAHHAMATDIDPNAIRATNENFAINEVSEQAEVQQVNILDKEEADSFYEKNNGKKYDVIVANILADVIIPLSGIVAPLLKDDGVFITSGIINTMEEAVKEAMLANHFEILEIAGHRCVQGQLPVFRQLHHRNGGVDLAAGADPVQVGVHQNPVLCFGEGAGMTGQHDVSVLPQGILDADGTAVSGCSLGCCLCGYGLTVGDGQCRHGQAENQSHSQGQRAETFAKFHQKPSFPGRSPAEMETAYSFQKGECQAFFCRWSRSAASAQATPAAPQHVHSASMALTPPRSMA